MSLERIEFVGEDDKTPALMAPHTTLISPALLDTCWINDQPDPGASTSRSSDSNSSTTNIEDHLIDNDSDEDGKLYIVLSTQRTYADKFQTEVSEITISVNEIKEKPEETLKKIFDMILENELSDTDEHTRVGIVLDNKHYTKPLYVSLRKRDQITSNVILAEVDKVLQSNEDFFMNVPLSLKITKVHVPNGQKRHLNVHIMPFHDFCELKKNTIARIMNFNDNLCLPRAIIVGMAHVQRSRKEIESAEFRALTRLDGSDLHRRTKAIQLCRDAGIDPTQITGDIADVIKFQEYLTDYKITVFCGTDRTGRTILHKGSIKSDRYIDLILGDNHYNVITNVVGAFGKHEYCRKCDKGYDHEEEHNICTGKCKKCKSEDACEPEVGYLNQCTKCKVLFSSSRCYTNHTLKNLKKNKSACDVTKYCDKCDRIYTLNRRRTKHICNYKVCTACNQYVEKSHLCFVQPKIQQVKKDDDTDLYVFFDFESRIDDVDGTHIPNYCVVQHQCTVCANDVDTITDECRVCGKREYFVEGKEGYDLVKEVFTIFGRKSNRFKKVYVFAHNGGGYDFHFIVKYMIMIEGWTPVIVKNGSKIIYMEYKNLIFKDTLNFFNCKLSALPKMFDIKDEVKGYFPHLFNKPENWEHSGSFPEAEDYGCDYMSAEDRTDFLKWHVEQKHQTFNFKEEMRKYCKADVDILRKASLKFRQLFEELLKIDPLTTTSTIASACMYGYRMNFMPRDVIGLMDFKTYHMRDQQSQMALRYMLYFENKYNIKLQSAYRGKEKEFGRYRVDGFYEKFPTCKLENFDSTADSRTEVPLIIEIQGCLFHGCPRCYSEEERTTPIGDQACFETLTHRYENTQKKMEYLRKLPIKPNVLEFWECDIWQQCTTDDSLRRIMQDDDILNRIKSNREAFFGGRTECFQKYYKTQPGEKIQYIDVNSLYPFINKYGVYPAGHPEVLIEDAAKQCQLENVTGIAKIRIVPPKQLFFPIIPVRANNKLIFSLCRTCAEHENKDTCNHSEEERQITGTYTCVEINEAVQHGYEIKDVYEVWSYTPTKYDKQSNTGGLFAEYINKFLLIKQAASGYPPNVKTEQEKIKFCAKFEEKEGIPLEPDSVRSNTGLRSLSKLCLNSLWGKFGQRNRLQHTEIIKREKDFYPLVVDPEKEITDVAILKNGNNKHKDDLLMVSWKSVEECAVDKDFINPVVSAYVTAQARLYLFQFLKRLNDRVLYCDTDSIIYVHHPGDEEIETGPYLGEMGDEMDSYTNKFGPGCYISEFVCEGPKNYSFEVVNVEGVCVKRVVKIRGFTLNYSASQLLNLNTMKNFVTSETPANIEIITPLQIQRKRHFNIISKEAKKVYKPIPPKRRFLDKYRSVPYGWVDDEEEEDDNCEDYAQLSRRLD